MAAVCWTCRSPVQQVVRVYNLAMEGGDCPLCLMPACELCVAVPCGHPVCTGCARGWAARLATWVQVPGGTAAPTLPVDDPEENRRRWWYEFGDDRASDTESAETVEDDGPEVVDAPPPAVAADPRPVPYAAEPMLPPPWVLPPPWAAAAPPPAVEPTMPPPGAPTLGEAFLFTGRLVSWVRLWRFGTKIILVWADSGRLCKGGDHVVRPTGIDGFVVKWHVAVETANRKWVLEAEVHDV